jgi:hypothetical protein
MKKLIFMYIVAILSQPATNRYKMQQPALPILRNVSATNAPVMKFEKETHDFGKIKTGEKVTYMSLNL